MLAYRRIDGLGFTEAEKVEVRETLATYCFERSLRRKEEAYRRLIAPHGILDLGDEQIDIATLQKLSPAGQVGSLSAACIHHPRSSRSPVSA